MTVTYYHLNGKTYHIPEVWIMGRSRQREQEGMSPKEAFKQACEDWVEQARRQVAYEAGQ